MKRRPIPQRKVDAVRKLVIFGVILCLLAAFLVWKTRDGGWVLLGAVGATLASSPLIEYIGRQDPAQLDQTT
jgi:uncharacterized membrane protein YeaQ/YmgE (transglycosylase-associated protein family)